MKRGEAFNSPMFRAQSFIEPLPLDCELYKCFIFFFSLHLDGTAWLDWAGVDNSLAPDKLGSDNTPAGFRL